MKGDATVSTVSRRTVRFHVATICPFDTQTDSISIALRGTDGRPLRSLAALRQDLGPTAAAQVRFAVNGGMYDVDGEPVGLFVAEGKTVKPLNLRKGPGTSGDRSLRLAGRKYDSKSRRHRTPPYSPVPRASNHLGR